MMTSVRMDVFAMIAIVILVFVFSYFGVAGVERRLGAGERRRKVRGGGEVASRQNMLVLG